jgi:signal transduction histidine kinase
MTNFPGVGLFDNGLFRTNKLFRGISPEIVDPFLEAARPELFAPDSIIFREGDSAENLFLIGSGDVRISKMGRGGRHETLAFFKTDDFFGEMGLYDREVRSAHAAAVGPVMAGLLDRAGFEELLRAAPAEIVTNLLRESVVRLRQTDTHFIREILETERLSLVGSMASTIFHDMKQPLSAIRMAAGLLAEDLSPDRRARFAGKIDVAVIRIRDMAQEILDYSQGGISELNLELISPAELIAEVDSEVLQGLSGSNVNIRCSVDSASKVALDRGRFFRVLQNLVKNAVDAMPNGGDLTLDVREEEGSIVFRVSDTGVGIPEPILPTIFEPFVTFGKDGGTGLGLAIVKSVVEAHGGRILVESTVGKGTTFTIWLPLR